jgi:DNA-binding NtrC family response regulator
MSSILLIEPDAAARALLAGTLIEAGHEVVTAERIADALRLLRHAYFSVVVMEVSHPQGEGIDAIVEMRRCWPACRIVATSAGGRFLTAADTVALARGVGAHVGLTKPVAASALLGALRSDQSPRAA